MKQVIVNVPERKLKFFTELIKQLQLEVVTPAALSDSEKVLLDNALEEYKT